MTEERGDISNEQAVEDEDKLQMCFLSLRAWWFGVTKKRDEEPWQRAKAQRNRLHQQPEAAGGMWAEGWRRRRGAANDSVNKVLMGGEGRLSLCS
jgi:hypothetical protein